MKTVIILCLLLQGCATAGTILKGMGNGLASGPDVSYQRDLNCIPDYRLGNQQHYICQ